MQIIAISDIIEGRLPKGSLYEMSKFIKVTESKIILNHLIKIIHHIYETILDVKRARHVAMEMMNQYEKIFIKSLLDGQLDEKEIEKFYKDVREKMEKITKKKS